MTATIIRMNSVRKRYTGLGDAGGSRGLGMQWNRRRSLSAILRQVAGTLC